jgi:hypothetical protein
MYTASAGGAANATNKVTGTTRKTASLGRVVKKLS